MAFARTAHLVKLDRARLQVFNKPRTVGHRQVVERFLFEIDYDAVDANNSNMDDINPPVQNWDRSFALDADSMVSGAQNDDCHFSVYTDGSQNEDGLTWAGYVVYMRGDRRDSNGALRSIEYEAHSFHLGSGNFTVFQSELFALNNSLGSIAFFYANFPRRDKQGETIHIHVDNKAALLAVTGNFVKSQQVLDIVERLNFLGRRHTVVLRWVKAHVGHLCNEKADRLAKQGVDDPSLQVANLPSESVSSGRARMNDKVVKYWNDWWQALPTCRQTKHFFPKVDRQLAVDLCKSSRVDFSATIQFITGHNFLYYHQTLVDFGYADEAASACRHCITIGITVRESTFHVLAECGKYNEARRGIWHTDLLTHPLEVTAKQIYKFMKDAQLPTFVDVMNYSVNRVPNPVDDNLVVLRLLPLHG